MITPKNPITQSAATFDGLWISNLNIAAPLIGKPYQATIRLTPFNSTSSVMAPNLAKNLFIKDLASASAANPALASAMTAVYAAIQAEVASGSLF